MFKNSLSKADIEKNDKAVPIGGGFQCNHSRIRKPFEQYTSGRLKSVANLEYNPIEANVTSSLRRINDNDAMISSPKNGQHAHNFTQQGTYRGRLSTGFAM